jgi:hypothetical protein
MKRSAILGSLMALALIATFIPIIPFRIETNVSPMCMLSGNPRPPCAPIGPEQSFTAFLSITYWVFRVGGAFIVGQGYGFPIAV